MPTIFPIRQFGGLNLLDDPEAVGGAAAIDLLNTDLSHPGRISTRDGYDNFTASVIGSVATGLCPFYTVTGTRQLIVATDTQYHAYDTSGALIASTSGGVAKMIRWGNPSADYVIVVAATAITDLKKWDGSAWTTEAGPVMGAAQAIGITGLDNRLVLAGSGKGGEASRIRFSDAGDPFTWNSTNFVDLTPGDGEAVMALATYRDTLFAFKESRFAVFTGTSVDNTGNATFNYRLVSAGVGAVSSDAWCVGRDGVYFLDRKGLYRTNGAEPEYLSRDIEPLFFGAVPDSYGGSAINDAQWSKARLTFHRERIYIAVPTGSSTTNDRLLVYDPRTGQWVVWDVPAASLCTFRVADDEELMFGYATGLTHVGRHSESFATDDGTAIGWNYRSGWYDLGYPDQEKNVLLSSLTGTGTVTLSRFRDFATTDANAGAVTLGTAPAVATARHRKSWRGTLMSHKLSGSGAARVSGLTHEVRSVRTPGLQSPLT